MSAVRLPELSQLTAKWESASNQEKLAAAVAGGATLALAGVLAYRRCVAARAAATSAQSVSPSDHDAPA